MEIVNLTPHDVVVGGKVFHSKGSARVVTRDEVVTQINGIDIVKIMYDRVRGLPDPKPGKLYIVSYMVLQALPDRVDLVCPARLERDGAGNVVGCGALETYISPRTFRDSLD